MNKIVPITIVCATHNGAKRLPKLLNSILKHTLTRADYNMWNITF